MRASRDREPGPDRASPDVRFSFTYFVISNIDTVRSPLNTARRFSSALMSSHGAIGIDVHKLESQLCNLSESGEMVERRIRTQRERFAAAPGERAPAGILIEASTESERVAEAEVSGV